MNGSGISAEKFGAEKLTRTLLLPPLDSSAPNVSVVDAGNSRNIKGGGQS
jgi:hypothetical protein